MNTLHSFPEGYEELDEVFNVNTEHETLDVNPDVLATIARREPLVAALILAYSISGQTGIEMYEDRTSRHSPNGTVKRVRLIW